MSESVTEFQVQVTSIMDLLMKVAVKEITKLFEGRYLSEGMPNTGERENDHHQLTLLSDLRNELESAAARSGERCVCSIGVQVGDEPLTRERTGTSPLPSPHIKSRSSSKESTPKTDGSERSPNEKLKKADSDGLRDEAVDLHCTVDLPYKDGKHVNQRHTPEGKQHDKQPFTTADDTMEFDGLFDSLRKTFAWPDLELDQPTVVLEETLCEEKERPAQNKDNVASQKSPLKATVTPDCPIACVATPASSQSTNTTSKSPQSGCESKENVELLSNTLSPDHSKDKQAETVAAAKPVSPLTQKPAHVQLGVRHQDWKLLRPCAVHLINVRLFSGFASQLRSGAAAHKGSVRPKDLRVHQGPHTGRRLCCFKEVRDGLWRVHHNLTPSSATSTPGCSPLICEKCHKTFKRRKLLRRHERFHSGERPYACNLCDKTFTLRKSLRRHLRFHTGERPHLCPHCSKSFRLKDNLKTHLRFHTGERPYACTLCPKRYRILKNLETHQLTH